MPPLAETLTHLLIAAVLACLVLAIINPEREK